MSTIHRQIGNTFALDWEGAVEIESAVKIEGEEGKVIIGPQDGKPNYFVRYFRVEPEVNASLDPHAHAHDHGVYIIHGRAEVLLGDETVELAPHDIVYIPGNVVHRFRAIGSEPLGFLCIVPPH